MNPWTAATIGYLVGAAIGGTIGWLIASTHYIKMKIGFTKKVIADKERDIQLMKDMRAQVSSLANRYQSVMETMEGIDENRVSKE